MLHKVLRIQEIISILNVFKKFILTQNIRFMKSIFVFDVQLYLLAFEIFQNMRNIFLSFINRNLLGFTR